MTNEMLNGSVDRLLRHLDRAYADNNYENVNLILCSLLELYVRLGMRRQKMNTVEDV